VAFGLGILFLGGCGGSEQAAPTPPAPTVAVETGGMALSGAADATASAPEDGATNETGADGAQSAGESNTGDGAAAGAGGAVGAESGATGAEDNAEDTAEDSAEDSAQGTSALGPVLAVGAQIIAPGTTAVYAEPDPAALRYAEYPGSATFIVVEPGSDFAAYPVDVGGQRWYRVRAPDGLVGWVAEVR
jgi:hypothetical protein